MFDAILDTRFNRGAYHLGGANLPLLPIHQHGVGNLTGPASKVVGRDPLKLVQGAFYALQPKQVALPSIKEGCECTSPRGG